jgi:phosphatidyl-myo-inositol dimannoside synthase
MIKVGVMARNRNAGTVLLLAPSDGLGGGIERYLDSVRAALAEAGVRVVRVDLRRPDRPLRGRAKLLFAARAVLSGLRHRRPGAVLVGHRSFVPLAAVVVALARPARAPVLFYGSDIFGLGRFSRVLLRRSRLLAPLTISGFSAGALATLGVAPVLHPGLDPAWRDMLIAAAATRRAEPYPADAARVLTVFRLSEWESKGLPELLAALAELRRSRDVRLVVAGLGPAPAGLRAAIDRYEDVELVESPSDRTLAGLYAAADLFALCTRTRTHPPSSGEGFGMVLTEAQLTGCPVVGPVSGGSRDAYGDGVTGRTPVDESATALARTMADLLADRPALAEMGRRAAVWAAAATRPDDHADRVARCVLGPAYVPTPATAGATGRPPRQRSGPRRAALRRAADNLLELLVILSAI